ncbi:MAG: ribonuclease P protein component 1 [Candidatus Hadarchaeota archaeon]
MSATKKNMFRHELIGLEARVISSPDAGLAGVSGKILDETRGTLVIEAKGGRKVVPKSKTTFGVNLGGGEVKVPGDKILGRPEDRVKR